MSDIIPLDKYASEKQLDVKTILAIAKSQNVIIPKVGSGIRLVSRSSLDAALVIEFKEAFGKKELNKKLAQKRAEYKKLAQSTLLKIVGNPEDFSQVHNQYKAKVDFETQLRVEYTLRLESEKQLLKAQLETELARLKLKKESPDSKHQE